MSQKMSKCAAFMNTVPGMANLQTWYRMLINGSLADNYSCALSFTINISFRFKKKFALNYTECLIIRISFGLSDQTYTPGVRMCMSSARKKAAKNKCWHLSAEKWYKIAFLFSQGNLRCYLDFWPSPGHPLFTFPNITSIIYFDWNFLRAGITPRYSVGIVPSKTWL